jgi:hypothetical protein
VKSLRIWLLLLLVVLLPVRGAVAAAMLCPPSDAGSPMEVVVSDHHVGPEVVNGAAHHDHAQDHHAMTGGEQGHGASQLHAPENCNLCSAICSFTPMVNSPPQVAAPQEIAAVAFPDLDVPALSFLLNGQERPPRSI